MGHESPKTLCPTFGTALDSDRTGPEWDKIAFFLFHQNWWNKNVGDGTKLVKY